jgi:hypothetical protein
MDAWFGRGLRATAVAALIVYIVWNAWWLAQGRIPRSLLKGLTGLPSPTTGGTRSVEFLVQGNWRESLRAHPLAVPIILLFGYCLLHLAWQAYRRTRLVLPSWVAWAWALLLLAAWAAKLAGTREYW